MKFEFKLNDNIQRTNELQKKQEKAAIQLGMGMVWHSIRHNNLPLGFHAMFPV